MKASLVIDYHLNNKIFDLDDKKVNRDDYAYSIWLLRRELFKIGIELSTFDVNDLSESGVGLYFDILVNKVSSKAKKNYLFLFESEVIKTKSWDIEKHDSFSKVFTWHDCLVDNEKYFKMNFSHRFPDDIDTYRKAIVTTDDKKLCTLIAGNKKVNHPLELYSEREKTIQWFEKNAKNDFDFYGIGWNKYTSSNRFLRYFLSKFDFINDFFSPKYSCYKGSVDSKKIILSNYKFSICYENAQNIPGYITEKIFDCFFAGCVPVYWGAPNISDHIPENCFIDRRKFSTHEELYFYMKNMSIDEYQFILSNIEEYIFSEKANPYRAEIFVETVVRNISDDLK